MRYAPRISACKRGFIPPMVSLGRVYPSTPAGLEAPPRLRLWPLPTVLALALLAYNVAQLLTAPFERIAPAGYRCWDDFGVAVRLYRHDRARPATAESSDFAAARQEVERLSLRPWQFWRTADESRFPGVSALDAIRPLDDVGRGRLLGALF